MSEQADDFAKGIVEAAERERESMRQDGAIILATDPPEDFGMSAFVGAFAKIETSDDVRKCIDDMSLLQEMLKHEREYSRLAAEYLVLEAKMWMSIVDHWRAVCESYREAKEQTSQSSDEMAVEYDGQDGAQFLSLLSLKERRIFDFVRQMDDAKREEMVARCGRGESINQQRLSAMACENVADEIERYRQISKKIVEDFTTSGTTVCSVDEFNRQWSYRKPMKLDTAKAYVESTRDRLLRSGAVGVGDGVGTYIDPKNTDNEKIQKAVRTRIYSLISDVKKLHALCEEVGCRPENDLISYLRREILSLLADIEMVGGAAA